MATGPCAPYKRCGGLNATLRRVIMGVSHRRPAIASKPPVKLMEIAEALDRAIVAHAKWKYRLMTAIDASQSEWRVADVRNDVACEFGKWLAALPLSERLSDRLKQVRSLHAEFHVLASNVLELCCRVVRRKPRRRWPSAAALRSCRRAWSWPLRRGRMPCRITHSDHA